MNQLLIALRGVAMGMAEVVPGVSGGTIALVTGIYERFINCIKSVDGDAIKLLFSGQIAAFWKKLDGNFLVFLLGGMFVGIGIGVKLITHLLVTYPLQVWGFFFGLIVASSLFVGKQVTERNAKTIVAFVVSLGLALWVTSSTPGSGSESLLLIFGSGVIAISAMLLPGLSGSFLLLIMGMYTVIMPRVKDLMSGDTSAIPVVAVFALGCLVGAASFSRVLSWAYKNFQQITLASLTGFMIGSLNKVWPWQQVMSTRLNSKGEEVVLQSTSVLPNAFSQLSENFLYGTEPKVMMVCICAVIGFALVFGIDVFGSKKTA